MSIDNDRQSRDDTIIDLNPDDVVETGATKPVEQAAPKAKLASSRWPLWGAAALVLGAIGGGWLYRDMLSPYLPSDQMSRVIEKAEVMEKGNAALHEQLATLDNLSLQFKTDIDALELSVNTANSNAKTAESSVQNMGTRVDAVDAALKDLRATQLALQDALTKLPSGPSAPAGTVSTPSPDLTSITQRLDSLEKDMASMKAGSLGTGGTDLSVLSQALSDLKAKFAAGTPYADELSRVQQMAPAAPGLDDLQRHAALGVPNAAALSAALKSIAVDLSPSTDPATAATPDDSWLGWASNMLSDIVTIRNAGDADWVKTAEAAAAFAESGDLPQAISHVSDAEGAKPPALQQWLEQAQARVKLEVSLTGVEAAVLRMLAAKG